MVLAGLAGCLCAVALGAQCIPWLSRWMNETICSDSPELNRLHRGKERTPTMGGLFIFAAWVLVAVFLVQWTWSIGWIVAGTLAFVALGAVDDWRKARGKGKGLSPRQKLLGQFAIASVVVGMLFWEQGHDAAIWQRSLPFLANQWPLGWVVLPLAVLTIVGSSNAVNLTDGLDGLAGGCVVVACIGLAAVAVLLPHAAAYSDEVLILLAAAAGSVLGFLRYNLHPARVFMGDTGSLALGGFLGMAAVALRLELWLALAGGVFVLEAVSVILQVGFFKWTKKRIFLCAPLHHHFEMLGWPEQKIVLRFWTAAALCAATGLWGMVHG